MLELALSAYLNPVPPTAITSNYQLQSCQCTPNFNPTPGKYVLSAWIKGNGKIDVKLLNSSYYIYLRIYVILLFNIPKQQ